MSSIPRQRSAATLQSVAAAAGVHVSTVSRALNPQTRHLVETGLATRIGIVASELGYRRNPIAVSLRTRRSRMVGIVLPDIANPVFGPILAGLEAALAAQGYSALVANAGSDAREGEVVESLIDRGVDALVLATARRDDPVLRRCLDGDIPTVLVNRAEDTDRLSSVVSDDVAGLALATGHLLSLGHRAIAHLAGPLTLSTGLLRRAGYERAMRDAGLAPAPSVSAGAYTRAEGLIAARTLLSLGSWTAIACANDLLALGLYDALAERGLCCPGDISVTGHNDMPLVDMIAPPLTTVRIPHREIGRLAADMVLERLAAPTPRRYAAPWRRS